MSAENVQNSNQKPLILKTAFREVKLNRPLWMAIVNATPDSFSDGGRADVVGHAMKLLAEGADILDVGGESTRPGCDPVSADVEMARIHPVLDEILERCEALGVPKPLISVDTYHPETARFAVTHGVELLNDISGAVNPEMVRTAVESGAALCFMQMQGTPKTMQLHPHYENVLEEIFTWLAERRDALLAAGVEREKLIVDPGIGFGKTLEQNWDLIENVGRFHDLGLPVLIGHSRKGFLKRLTEADPMLSRDDATQLVSKMLVSQGVQVLRTHEKPYFIHSC